MNAENRLVDDQQSKTSDFSEWSASADLIVVGSGIAGLTAALRARELGLRTLVVTKGTVTESNTRWAQGGLAVVLDGGPGEGENGAVLDGGPGEGENGAVLDGGPGEGGDSPERHVADTVAAGGGLCDPEAARSVIGGGAAAVRRLMARGATFDPVAGTSTGHRDMLARTREGGHSAFRVIHAGGDATGAEVERALAGEVTRARIPVLEHHIAVGDVPAPHGGVGGLRVLDPHGSRGVLRAPAVLLATGGFGQLYQATSNPDIATGDGLALALRAGATAADLEFVQFHPTVLYVPGARGRCPLVTEAVRGEGAVLIDAAGDRVMQGVHPQADLAPRDVVSAAITRRMAQAPHGVDDHVYLDATAVPDFAGRFPTVHAACLRAGVDPVRAPIPVAPAAHFACGGVLATPEGRTDVRGLYAAGEVARTGLHGANRLASNSLLEGLVVGERAAEAVAADLAAGLLARARHSTVDRDEPACRVERDVLQRAMSRYAAIGRDAGGLSTLRETVASASVVSAVDGHRDVEDAALTLIAKALLVAAGNRTESRGCHVRADFGDRDDARWQHSQRIRLDPSGEPVLTAPLPLRDAA
ncbi:L-aspartate oxidase [Haloechinothrix sp. YIM 98757]|uniref:L-aspartate oxidase n=1 Tax=Haloechinothrix aidingensis TaxID=2752311 RepID=A0A838A8E5_9PSEU|nr:L-aspartate oxidase [Haloechinothrix aidingensis]MBA0125615.1 L-aspartate oxidase [Haloechinothrix aidingensis]